MSGLPITLGVASPTHLYDGNKQVLLLFLSFVYLFCQYVSTLSIDFAVLFQATTNKDIVFIRSCMN